MAWGCILTSSIYMWLSSFPNTICGWDYLFSIVYSCLICWRLIDHRYVGYFYSIDPHVYFCANTILFWLPQFCSIVWSLWRLWLLLWSFTLGLLLQLFLFICMFPNKFWDICFSSVKNVIVALTEIALNLWIAFCSVGITTILILPIKYHGYLSISLNHLQFPLSMFNICQHIVLLPP